MKKTICYLLLFCFSLITTGSFASAPDAETNYFEFRSSYLLNLHHYLIKEGIRYNKTDSSNRSFESFFIHQGEVNSSSKSGIMSAVKYYGDSVVKKNMLFDPELNSLKYTLLTVEAVYEIPGNSISPLWLKALKSADAYYKDQEWKNTNAKNLLFINSHVEQVKKIEKEVIGRCEDVYQYKFTGKKFRIEIVDYATFFGAYTTNDPFVCSVISSTDKRHDAEQGTEVIFHEVSHSMIDSLFKMQQDLCKATSLRVDHNVWHTILFYSTGTIVKDALAGIGVKHELYIYRNDLGGLSPDFRNLIDKVSAQWPLYMNRKIPMEDVLKKILN
ncbi:MAG: hypothetical protein ABI772_11975 [Bacteroidota bacterium]